MPAYVQNWAVFRAEMVRIHCFQKCWPEWNFNRPIVMPYCSGRDRFPFNIFLLVADTVSCHHLCLPLLPPLAWGQVQVMQQRGAAWGERGPHQGCHRDVGAFSTALGFSTVVEVQTLSRTPGKKEHGLWSQATVPCLSSLLRLLKLIPLHLGWWEQHSLPRGRVIWADMRALGICSAWQVISTWYILVVVVVAGKVLASWVPKSVLRPKVAAMQNDCNLSIQGVWGIKNQSWLFYNCFFEVQTLKLELQFCRIWLSKFYGLLCKSLSLCKIL